MSKQKVNWIVDGILFIGFLSTFFLDWTGLFWHQWLGVFLGILALYHLLIHWNWVTAVTKRLLGKTSQQSRIYYLLDWTIFLTFLLIGLSGIWISTWLNLDPKHYLFYKDLHVYSSIISLILILVKIATHWRWIVKTARTYFGVWKSPAPVGATAVKERISSGGSLDRREFLQLMGIAGMASLLSAANLVDFSQAAGQAILENQTSKPQQPDTDLETASSLETSCQGICDQGCTYPGQCRRFIDQNGNGICDLTECVTEDLSPQETEKSTFIQEDLNSSLPQRELESLSAGEDTGECSVLCPKGCAYPGECGDYRDMNNNGLCDLGECLEDNYDLESPVSSHSGGGGRKRRGKQ
jgi:hypothetical protein